ncbi:MAG: LysR substrate-binding domain-containing protein, partial [Pseudobdellovibrio sp.]
QQYSIAVSDEIERPFISDLLGKLVNRVSVDHKFQIISKPQSEIAPEFSVGKKYDILITNREIKKIKPVKAWDLPVNLITSKKLVETYKVKNTGLKSILAGLGEKLVIPTQGTLLREEMEDYFVQHKIETEVIFESNILGCVTRAIKQKLGSGLLPAPYVAEELKSKDLVLLGPAKGFWQHQIFLYTQTPFEKDLMAQKINNAIQESLNFE